MADKSMKRILGGVDKAAAAIKDREERKASQSKGREGDLSIPYSKRRDSYGEPLAKNQLIPRMEKAEHEDYVKAVDKKNPTVSKRHYDEAKVHIQSLDGHAKATAKSKAMIDEALKARKK